MKLVKENHYLTQGPSSQVKDTVFVHAVATGKLPIYGPSHKLSYIKYMSLL